MSQVPRYDSIQFGEAALKLRAFRQEVISSNLVNADTPGFRAKDISFGDVLRQTLDKKQPATASSLMVTDPRHIGGSKTVALNTEFRSSVQPALDGNTVDPDVERSEFMKNSFYTEATLNFLSSSIKGRLSAITGQAQ